MDLIERVARAITIAEGDNPDGHTGSLLNNYELWWEHRIPQARAAIEAIEPTEEMEAAFAQQGYKRTNFKLQFKAAMNAALGKVDA